MGGKGPDLSGRMPIGRWRPPPDQLTQSAPDAAAGVRYVNPDLQQFGTSHTNTKAMRLGSKDEPTYKLRKLMKLI